LAGLDCFVNRKSNQNGKNLDSSSINTHTLAHFSDVVRKLCLCMKSSPSFLTSMSGVAAARLGRISWGGGVVPQGISKPYCPTETVKFKWTRNSAFLLWPKTQNSRPGRNSPIAICFVPETLVTKSQAAEILSYLYL
jgi:hypothetical protein